GQVLMEPVMYTARVLEKVLTKPGCWESLRVGVFEDDNQIGEYTRNYPALYDTFFPFEVDGRWLALYSREYMYTRVMSLPDCKDLGGENRENTPYANHFCPVDYFVPQLTGRVPNPQDPQPQPAILDKERWGHKVLMKEGWTRYHMPTDNDH